MTLDAEPYLSVVVTSRNDHHGGDPLMRLQAFVNSFDAHCRRTGLDAEVIVVEWNPPDDRPKLESLVRLPDDGVLTYRFIEVPPALHHTLQHADVLPLFQMIAKNAGIRRARGRFVLATNIDIIFSPELVAFVASKQLRPGHVYRVDRHDIENEFPLDATIEQQMAYAKSHQLRVHKATGSYPVDAQGGQRDLVDDVVDGRTVRLGGGWHVPETADGRPFRWATDAAELIVDPVAASIDSDAVLELEIQSNPYDEQSWVVIVVAEGERQLSRQRVSGRSTVVVALDKALGSQCRRIQLRVVDMPPEYRCQLPAFERRDALFYRVHRAALHSAACAPTDRRSGGSGPHWISRAAGRVASAITWRIGERLRSRIVQTFPEFRALEQTLRESERRLTYLQGLGDLATFLRIYRPVNLHTNGCGDFQMMAREHWNDLRGYPEFETFSMNIDGLFSYIADAAGIKEQTLEAPIYHLEHDVGSGWSPEGEALLRKRIAERGITWLDASTVYIWAAYMQWLRRPMVFNGASWGLSDAQLPERTFPAFSRSM
ncbi:MAG: hypothetical protein DMG02_10260 [Acidobacteria bacterium]|nr:MAG: hypothetical protein DMG02_10260 [Acidobacteriota bacterium]